MKGNSVPVSVEQKKEHSEIETCLSSIQSEVGALQSNVRSLEASLKIVIEPLPPTEEKEVESNGSCPLAFELNRVSYDLCVLNDHISTIERYLRV